MNNIEITTHPNQNWAFTYKYLGNVKANHVSTYCPVLNNLQSNGHVKYCAYEKDPSDRVHIHGIVVLRKGFLRKKLCVPGFHCHLSEIVNEDIWLKYCRKDVPATSNEVPYLFDPMYEI